jgi:CBS domain-containing membrane protein
MTTSFLARWLPQPNNGSRREQLRACAGAICGLLLTGLICHFLLAPDSASVYLIAPMGASAVLLFCLPASPLAQPWSVVGGNVVSGLMGMACVKWLGPSVGVAALAACLAIGAMFALRCLHPPGGAVALTTVVGGASVHAAGFEFVFITVLFNSAVLVACAVLYNNLTGRRYPHIQQLVASHPHATKDDVPSNRLGFSPDDLDAVLRQHSEVLDISRDDLQAIFLQTEMRAYQRRFGVVTCADIMSKDVLSVEFGTPLDVAWRTMREHDVGALPVVNRARRVIGIITQTDFLRHGGLDDYQGMRQRLRGLLQRSGLSHSDKPEVVGQLMTPSPHTARLGTPIIDLVPLMADAGYHHIPIVDDEERLAGIISQSDLMAALYESRFAEAAA